MRKNNNCNIQIHGDLKRISPAHNFSVPFHYPGCVYSLVMLVHEDQFHQLLHTVSQKENRIADSVENKGGY